MVRLVAPAGSCRRMLEVLGCGSAGELIDLIQPMVGPRYRVTGQAALIEAREDDLRGGRSDDARRAADLQRALADDRTAAIIALRGGAWLTRLLSRIDFEVLRGRSTRVAIFGFSELTTIINIAAAFPRAVCWYDLGPAFIPAGLAQRNAKTSKRQNAKTSTRQNVVPAAGRQSIREQFSERLAEFFADVVAIIEGRGSRRSIRGRLVAGGLPRNLPVKIVGGTLAVMISLIGTPYSRSIFRRGRWLAIEDVNEAPHRIDRMLAHLQLAGILERCAGLLIGDFHEGRPDGTVVPRTGQVLASLKRIWPRGSPMPIVVSGDFGHTWPMAPLPIGREVELRRTGSATAGAGVELIIPWKKLATRLAEPQP